MVCCNMSLSSHAPSVAFEKGRAIWFQQILESACRIHCSSAPLVLVSNRRVSESHRVVHAPLAQLVSSLMKHEFASVSVTMVVGPVASQNASVTADGWLLRSIPMPLRRFVRAGGLSDGLHAAPSMPIHEQ